MTRDGAPLSTRREVIALSDEWEATGIRKPWWDRTYAVYRWVVWLVIPQVVIGAVRGIYLIVVWLS